MTRRGVRILAICAGLAGASGALAQSQYGFHLVTHSLTPAEELTRETVSELFLDPAPRWQDDTPAVPVDHAPRALLRHLFSRLVHERPTAEIVRAWRRLEEVGRLEAAAFGGTGGEVTPRELASDQEVLDYVRSHPGAVGYVSADAELGRGVKVLKILDLEEPTRVMLVLDFSGSMNMLIDGRAKIDIARDAISQLLVDWDPRVQLGLTAYSHRDGGCDDIETVIPVGLADPLNIRATVAALQARGSTPLTRAVHHAARELGRRQKARLILISDGQETCGLDPCRLGHLLRATRVDFKAFVIGFDVNAKAGDQLRCLAHPTGGDYFPADDARSLLQALEEAVARARGEDEDQADESTVEDLIAFQYLPPGRFEMGSPPEEKGRGADETPHEVTLTRGLYVSETEVTRGVWRRIMGSDPSLARTCAEEPDACPVERVSWYDALAFANRLSERDELRSCYDLEMCEGVPGGGCADGKKRCEGGFVCQQVRFIGLDCEGYRLPTEAEWEYAARAETSTPFFEGEELTPLEARLFAREEGRSSLAPAEVRSFSPNLWGLYDLHGNVWEWVWDPTVAYPKEPVTDPVDTAAVEMNLESRSVADRGLRGGSWSDVALACRSANRHRASPVGRSSTVGLRVVRSAQ